MIGRLECLLDGFGFERILGDDSRWNICHLRGRVLGHGGLCQVVSDGFWLIDDLPGLVSNFGHGLGDGISDDGRHRDARASTDGRSVVTSAGRFFECVLDGGPRCFLGNRL